MLTDLGLSAADRQRVMSGELVTAELRPVSERDLAVAVAALVRTSPDALGKLVLSGAMVTADSQVRAFGVIKGAGSLQDFAKLQLTGAEAQVLAGARAGDALNLSAAEIAGFTAAAGTAAVQQQLRQVLLARYQSYRAGGLAGIAPYDRGGGRTTDHAADLRRASEATPALERYGPALRAVLLDYPNATAPAFEESFFWVKSIIHGKTTYTLTHVVVMPVGAARVVARRQFYVSTGYNGEQRVAGLLPVQDGTVVVYASHAFTDQVTGLGGAVKRSVGSTALASRVREIVETERTRATQYRRPDEQPMAGG